MEDRVVKICICIGPSSRTKKLIPFVASQKCDMFYYVGNPLLILIFIDTAYGSGNTHAQQSLPRITDS